MSSRKSLLTLIFGFFIGVFASSFLNLDYYFGLFIALFGLIFLSARFFHPTGGHTESGKIGSGNFYIILSMILLGASLGIARYELKNSYEFAFDKFINQKISFEGIITNEPQKTENYTKFIIKISKIENSLNPAYAGFREFTDKPIPNQKILIYSNLYPKLNYGDKIFITGKLQKPKKNSFKQNSDENSVLKNNFFDFPTYLAKDGIYYQMFYPEIEFVSSGNGKIIKQKLYSLKQAFTENIKKTVPEPASSLLNGISIGAKESISNDFKDMLIKTGVIHIIVLSGYNITIVANTIINFFKIFPLPRFFGTIFGALGIGFFSVITGGEPATVRAAIMALLAIIANESGKIYIAIYALIFAAFFMVLQNPMLLRFDASFQLSFLATLGIIFFTPLLNKRLKFIPEKFNIKENAVATLSAQAAVLPLLIYNTGSLSLFSIPLNILILSFIPITMFFGFLTGISGFLSFYLSYFFGLISYIFLAYEIWLINLFANLPFSYVNLPFF